MHPHHLEPSHMSSSFRGTLDPQEEAGQAEAEVKEQVCVEKQPGACSCVCQPVPKGKLTSTPAYQTFSHRKADMFTEYTTHKDPLERSAGGRAGGSEAVGRKGSPGLTRCDYLPPHLLVVGRSWTQRPLSRSSPSASPSTGLLCGRGCQCLPLMREGQTLPLFPHGHHSALLCSPNGWSADLQMVQSCR